jgi:hypothetical protein
VIAGSCVIEKRDKRVSRARLRQRPFSLDTHLVSHEPNLVLCVKAPALTSQLASSKELLVSSLCVVKDKEQTVNSELFKDGRILEQSRWRRRIRIGNWVRILRRVLTRALVVARSRSSHKRLIESRQVRRLRNFDVATRSRGIAVHIGGLLRGTSELGQL